MSTPPESRRAIERWYRALVAVLTSGTADLSQRQTAILLNVYLTPPPHTVRGLAATLAISKPAVTRAVAALNKLSLVRKRIDEKDRRNVLVERTVKGAVYLNDFGERIAAIMAKE
ncbi:MAG: winged helix-turn-helix transcriptional regulator [Rhodospirillales bacterium]|nr:winged helix-turn-helix transcriptional regulator [Rhodospirillales bacterium]